MADGAEPHAAISIHALLAESDPAKTAKANKGKDFYPRSPCGERLTTRENHKWIRPISIHALLAESDDAEQDAQAGYVDMSIHALLAESDQPGAV